MQLAIDDLRGEGKTKMEQDFHQIERRDGTKTSHVDFALGWMALAARYGHWNLFTEATAKRLRGPTPKR